VNTRAIFCIENIIPYELLRSVSHRGFKSGGQLAGAIRGKPLSVDTQKFAPGRDFAPSNDPAVFCRAITTTHGNIYRIPIP
jgi:hypothetical protein